MKTTLGLFLGAVLALSLAGCGNGGSSTGSGGSTGGSGGSGATGGSSGGSGGSGGSTSSGGSGGSTAMLDCASYCTEMDANCTGDNAMYSSDDACKGTCATWMAGMLGDTKGATLGCHLYHGGDPAKSDAKTHCPHAGPLGSGVCGDDCANFCAAAVAVCGSQATPPYKDAADCMTACAAFPGQDKVPYSAKVTSGDSLACRMYHLTVASSSADMAKTHCAHVAAMSDPCQ
jgi:hypothetical protein